MLFQPTFKFDRNTFELFKDTLKAANDFKNKHEVYEVMFLICKCIYTYILKVYSIHCT